MRRFRKVSNHNSEGEAQGVSGESRQALEESGEAGGQVGLSGNILSPFVLVATRPGEFGAVKGEGRRLL